MWPVTHLKNTGNLRQNLDTKNSLLLGVKQSRLKFFVRIRIEKNVSYIHTSSMGRGRRTLLQMQSPVQASPNARTTTKSGRNSDTSRNAASNTARKAAANAGVESNIFGNAARALHIVIVGEYGCHNKNDDVIKKNWRKLADSQTTVEYFCNDVLAMDLTIYGSIVGKYVGIGKLFTQKTRKGINEVYEHVADKLNDESKNVLLLGWSYGGLVSSVVVDHLERERVLTQNTRHRFRAITFGAVYLSPSDACTHYVIAGDHVNTYNRVVSLLNGKKQKNIQYANLAPRVIAGIKRKLGYKAIHQLYAVLMRDVVKYKILPDIRSYRYCFSEPVFMSPRRQRVFVNCYDDQKNTYDRDAFVPKNR